MSNNIEDDDDDLDWEDWLKLTDEQQEAAITYEVAELKRKFDAMTISKQIAHNRYFILRHIRMNRARLNDPKLNHIDAINQIWAGSIKRSQMRLLKLRTWRTTGIYPGQG